MCDIAHYAYLQQRGREWYDSDTCGCIMQGRQQTRESLRHVLFYVCLMTICVFDTTHYAYIIWRHITLYAWHHSLCIHHLEPPAKEESASSIYCYMWVWHHSWCMHHTTSYNVKRHTIIWCDITPRHYAYVVCIIHGVATISRLPNNIGL